MIAALTSFNGTLALAQALSEGGSATVAGRMRVSDRCRQELVERYLQEKPEADTEEAERELAPIISFAENNAPAVGERPDAYLSRLVDEIVSGEFLEGVFSKDGGDNE